MSHLLPTRFGATYALLCCRLTQTVTHALNCLHSLPVIEPVSVGLRAYCSCLRLLCSPLVALLLFACFVPGCVSVGSRYQHNVWHNGLFISGLAVDESSGDVFFSDAAGNRVIHQSANGTTVHVYTSTFFSPMQLSYTRGKLYVADSTNNRVGVIDVANGHIKFSSSSHHLSSASALAVDRFTDTVFVVDGWGLSVDTWLPDSDQWLDWVDLSGAQMDPPPSYLASVTCQSYGQGSAELLLTDPKQLYFYYICNEAMTASIHPPNLGVTAIQYYMVNTSALWLYFLNQVEADDQMQIILVDDQGSLVHQWTLPGTRDAAMPFYGWAMHVDSTRHMYISAHGVDEQSSPYGRVVKIAPNGTELAQWSMSDGTAYSFTSIWYDDQTTSCAFWMVDRDKGMVRVAADGSVLLPFYDAPTDPADNRRARFSGMAEDTDYTPFISGVTFVLLDISDESTTKLWRFLPYNHTFILINTSAAQLGPNMAYVAVDAWVGHYIFVSDTRTHSVKKLDFAGNWDDQWDVSGSGIVEPTGLFYYHHSGEMDLSLFVAGCGQDMRGVVVHVDVGSMGVLNVINDTTPPMWRPLSVTVDTSNNQLYVADSNGFIFQFDITQSYTQQAAHQAVPTANNIVSMTTTAKGNLYMLDAYSHRLVILMWASKGWNPGDDCIPAMLSSSTSVRPDIMTHSSTSAWSSSSSASSTAPVPRPIWSAAVVISVAIAGVVAAAGGAACFHVKWRMRRWSRARERKDALEKLMTATRRQERQEEQEEEEDVDVGALAVSPREVETHNNNDEHTADERASVTISDTAHIQLSDVETRREATGMRYENYVARYEVVTAVSGMMQLNHTSQQVGLLMAQPLYTNIPQLPGNYSDPLARASSATAHTASNTAISLFSSNNRSTKHAASATTQSSASSSAATTRVSDTTSSISPLLSPSHIAQLQSVLRIAPTFIDTVTDLCILGEGSSGVVYRGMHCGVACVVKLPKSVSLTGAAWREWQCHLCLPPHTNLVRFLGALPMSTTNYLVLCFVRQGSLHSLLVSSTPSSRWYSRPYGVMSCIRDMSAVLHHIHSCGIVHRDVSCRNILVDSDGCMVLADFGLAAQQPSSPYEYTPAVDELQTAVAVRWTSPESLATSHFSSKSDVWSLGVALWEMTARGRLPYGERQTNTKACIRPIIARQLTLHVDDDWGMDGGPSLAEWKLAGRCREVIQLCLTHDVERRPDTEQLKRHVDRAWEEWKVEAGNIADQLQTEWVTFHCELQHRLGPANTPRSCQDTTRA